MSYHLVTTADERSWKFDRPVLFLGEWCRLYGRKQVWQGMDAVVAAPFGLAPEQKQRNLSYVQYLADQLLTELADALNVFHQTQHSRRYWHIVLGHWVQRCVAVTFNRYYTIEQALKSYDIASTLVFDYSNYSLATTDSLSFIWACNDDVWNHVLYARIIEFIGFEHRVILLDAIGEDGYFSQSKAANSSSKSLKQRARDAVNLLLPIFSKYDDAFIVNSYLPRVEELKLQACLWQVPQLWKSPALPYSKPDKAKRRSLLVPSSGCDGYERFVRQMICDLVPTCYVEDFEKLTQQIENLLWPEQPKFIFTSNNFDTDEIFKIWAASKVEKGTPYFTGQHGNNYGTLSGSENWPELTTSDKFLTWGWTNGNAKNVPAYALKTAGQKSRPLPDAGGLLLIEVCVPHRISSWDNYSEYGAYQVDQFRFVGKLPETIRQQLTVRLHAEFKKHRWSDLHRWSDMFPSVTLEQGVADIRKLMAESRLVVHSYDSTGILECLNLNIPMICFWPGGLEHLLPTAKPYYEQLIEAGILCETPDEAANKVLSHWDDISAWWMHRTVQNAREAFCEEFARHEPTPIRTLKKLLISEASVVREKRSTS